MVNSHNATVQPEKGFRAPLLPLWKGESEGVVGKIKNSVIAD